MAKRKKSEIIDAHQHADWHGYNLEKVIANMDKYGIAKSWLFTWECPENEWDLAYTYLTAGNLLGNRSGPIPFSCGLDYKKEKPERFVLGYGPDPRLPDAVDKMQAAIEIYGVQVCGEIKLRMMYDNPDAIRLYQFCGKRGLPVTFHLDYQFACNGNYPRPDYWYGGGIDAFERALQKCPNTILVGHGPGFWAHISGDDKYDKEAYPGGKVKPGGKVITLLRKYPNLYLDFSAGSGERALRRDPKFAKDFVLEFQDRFLYARDCFDNVHQKCLNSLNLAKTVKDKLCFKNAKKLIANIIT